VIMRSCADDDVEVVWSFLADEALLNRRVIVPVADIAEATGLDFGEVDDALADLGDVGLVSTWESDGHASATLSALAGERLGIKLRRSTSHHRGLAWIPVDKPDPRERQRRRKAKNATDLGLESLDRLAGSAERPDAIVSATEDGEARAPRSARKLADSALDPDRLPRPTRFIGSTIPTSALKPGQTCPACLGRPLRASEYCLDPHCGRWGLDWVLARIEAAEKRAASAKSRVSSKRAGRLAR